jgi:ABC-2 type transport system ATP-binding protein
VTIIREGVAVQSGTLDELRTTTRTAVTVSTDRPITGLESLAGVHAVHSTESSVHLEVDDHELGRVMSHLAGFGIRSLVSQPPTLEELFLREYDDALPVDDELGC